MRQDSLYHEIQEYAPQRIDFAARTNSATQSKIFSTNKALSNLENWVAGFGASSSDWRRTVVLFYILLAAGLGCTYCLPHSMSSHVLAITLIMLTFGGIGLAFLFIDPLKIASRNINDLEMEVLESESFGTTDAADEIHSNFTDDSLHKCAEESLDGPEETAHKVHIFDFEKHPSAEYSTRELPVEYSKPKSLARQIKF